MDNLAQIIDESIKLELNVSKLYSLFHEIFPEHGDFWWTLSIEEKNHASLLLTGRDHFTTLGMVPLKLLPTQLNKLEMTNYELKFLVEKFELIPPSEEDAFDLAIQIEQSVGELHFQEFMKSKSDNPLEKVFHQLNKDDVDHAERIRRYKSNFVNMGKSDLPVSSMENSTSR